MLEVSLLMTCPIKGYIVSRFRHWTKKTEIRISLSNYRTLLSRYTSLSVFVSLEMNLTITESSSDYLTAITSLQYLPGIILGYLLFILFQSLVLWFLFSHWIRLHVTVTHDTHQLIPSELFLKATNLSVIIMAIIGMGLVSLSLSLLSLFLSSSSLDSLTRSLLQVPF